MKLSKLLYFGDFVAAPAAILILAWLGLAGRDAGATLWWLLALVTGLFVWTFIEYVVHRWVYHQIPFFEAYHDAHHDDPDRNGNVFHPERQETIPRQRAGQ